MTEVCLQILKRDIHIPEIMDTDVALYPPSLLITTLTDSDFTPTSPKIRVEGLDRECGFNLLIPVSSNGLINGSYIYLILIFCIILVPVQQPLNDAAISSRSKFAPPLCWIM